MIKRVGKRGSASEHIPEILLIVAVLVILLLAGFLIPWGDVAEGIKNILRFGR